MSSPTVTPPPTTDPVVPVITEPQPYVLTPKEDGTVHLKLETGEEFSGKYEDILPKLAKSKVDTNRSYSGIKNELTQMREQMAPITAALQPKPAQPTEQEVANRQLQEFMATQTAGYLGFESADQMRVALSGMQEVTNNQQQQTQMMSFYASAQDFPGGDDNSNKLVETAIKYNLVANDGKGNITKYPSANQLLAAHALAIRDGVYKPLTQEEQAAARTGQYQNPKPPVAAPVLGGTQPEVTQGTPGTMTDRNLWTMPKEELNKLARAQGLIR